MRHPSTLAQRRVVWSLARTRYRTKLKVLSAWSDGFKPEMNLYWNRGGKQCEAHGNRCGHSIASRLDRRKLIKAARKIHWLATWSE